jgi:hypothetical protein
VKTALRNDRFGAKIRALRRTAALLITAILAEMDFVRHFDRRLGGYLDDWPTPLIGSIRLFAINLNTMPNAIPAMQTDPLNARRCAVFRVILGQTQIVGVTSTLYFLMQTRPSGTTLSVALAAAVSGASAFLFTFKKRQ